MPLPTTIRSLTVEPLDVPLIKPFGIAGGVQRVAEVALVTVELEDGTRGYGEAAPLPPYNGETREHAVDGIHAVRAGVIGEDARSWRRIAARVADTLPRLGDTFLRSGAARCAIETAVLDALTRHYGIPLWAFFGGAERKLITDVTISIDSVAEARAEAAQRATEGFTRLKVKVGGAEDVARVVAVHEAAPGAEIMLDGNAGFTVEGALDLLSDLRARGVEPICFEQPVHGYFGATLEDVARQASIHIVADESVGHPNHVNLLHENLAAHTVNVKLMKYGVAEALAIVDTARSHRMGLMIGGMVETKLAMSMSACFAAGIGGFHFVDLDTPLFLAKDPFTGGYAQRGPELDVSPIEAGHGVSPPDA